MTAGELGPSLRVSLTFNGETALFVTVRVFVHKDLSIRVTGVRMLAFKMMDSKRYFQTIYHQKFTAYCRGNIFPGISGKSEASSWLLM